MSRTYYTQAKKYKRWCRGCGIRYAPEDGYRGKCYECSLDADEDANDENYNKKQGIYNFEYTEKNAKDILYKKAHERLRNTGWFYADNDNLDDIIKLEDIY